MEESAYSKPNIFVESSKSMYTNCPAIEVSFFQNEYFGADMNKNIP